MAEARKPISKKTRFDVFKRDLFVCQYCGAHPPSVILHVDHINPVADGGQNDIDNLITSCEPCNLGKGARSLTDVPKSLKERASEVEERELQIQGYNAILQAKADRIEDEAWLVASALECQKRIDSYPRADLLSIKRFLGLLPLSEVIEAAEITAAQGPTNPKRYFRYFCAVCWNKVRASQQ